MAFRVVLALLCIVVPVCASVAQDPVKRSIFEDCEKATAEFSKLTVEEQGSLVDFFARVIALNTQSPSAPEVYAMAPATQLPGDVKGLSAPRAADVVPGALWQSMDAKRELRAKKCALDLLESSGALSRTTLASLVSTYSEQPLSDEIAVGVEEVAASIAEAAHLQGQTLEPAQLEAIVPHALGQRPLVARTLIHEFRDAALPYLVSLIATKGVVVGPELRQYLELIDPDGSRCMRATINLMPGLSVDQVRHLTTALPLPALRALSPFINDFIQRAADSALAPVFAPLLGRACTALGGFTIDATQQQTLASIENIFVRGTVSKAEAVCLLQSSSAMAKKLVEFLTNSDPSQQAYAVELCPEGLRNSSPELRGNAYTALRRLALEVSSPVWRESLHALAAFPERKTDTVAVALQLIKTASSSSDKAQSQRISAEVLTLLSSLSVGKEISRFSSPVIQALRSGDPTAALVVKSSPTLDPSVLSLALTIPPSQSSVTALEAVTSRTDIPQKAIASLLELLKYPEVSLLAERGLLSLGKSAATQIRKAIPRLQQGAAKMSAITVLVLAQVASKSEAFALTASLASSPDCSFISRRSELLCSLVKYHDADAGMKEPLQAVAQQCLPELSPEQLKRIAECNPDTVFDSAGNLGSALASGKMSVEQLAPITLLAIREMPIDSKRAEPLLAQLLRSGPAALQNQILEDLAGPNAVTGEVRSVIQDMTTNLSAHPDIAHNLARASVHITDSRYPWRDFIREALKAAEGGSLDRETANIISSIPVEPVLAEVLPALESDKSEKLVAAALVGGALGPKAIPLVSRLWHLRTMRSPAVRYTASLALLEINPLTPDMHETLRRLLVNRFFHTADLMPIDWANTVAVNDLKRGGFGTVRKERLERLLSHQ